MNTGTVLLEVPERLGLGTPEAVVEPDPLGSAGPLPFAVTAEMVLRAISPVRRARTAVVAAVVLTTQPVPVAAKAAPVAAAKTACRARKTAAKMASTASAAAAAEDPRRVITAAMGAREARAPLPSRAARQPRL